MPTRQENREQNTAAILEAARSRLAEVGPGELSLRAVARDVGMVSSAVYRYFPSRDELLTALLIEAYDAVGAAAVASDDPKAAPLDRWLAACRGVRTWALEHRHEWALIYGSPVIGYVAPQDTVVPATRVVFHLVDLITAAHAAGAPSPPVIGAGFDGIVDGAAEAVRGMDGVPDDLPSELVGRTLIAWSSLVGVVSFELWGHLVGSISDHDAWFDQVALRLAHDVGVTT